MVTGQVHPNKYFICQQPFVVVLLKPFCQPIYKEHFNGAAFSLMMTLACILFFLLIKSHKRNHQILLIVIMVVFTSPQILSVAKVQRTPETSISSNFLQFSVLCFVSLHVATDYHIVLRCFVTLIFIQEIFCLFIILRNNIATLFYS